MKKFVQKVKIFKIFIIFVLNVIKIIKKEINKMFIFIESYTKVKFNFVICKNELKNLCISNM
jgi:hypothetical protein